MSHPQFEAPSKEELHDLLPAYDVDAFIAQGGMGAVYQAHQKSLERDVAIKILPREFGADDDFRKRFEDEAKAMARLNHPNLIGVYDFGEVDGMPYIVMEFVDGKSLYHSAYGKAIEQKEVARIILGICEGLAHAHDAGILHRDVKPANILLDSKARPKIGDFGLARAVESGEGDAIIFGTPDYSAPEVTSNPDAIDKRSDVYAIGVILYELLTGQLPGKNYVPASQIEDVDPRFDKIVRRATHPSPTLRYADAGAMAKDLRELQAALEKPIATLVTQATPKTITPRGGEEGASPAPAAAPAPPPVMMQVDGGHQWALLRNLIVIVVLLIAIFGMWRAYQWKQADNEQKKKDDYAAKQEAEQVRLAQQEEERRAADAQRERDRERAKTRGLPDGAPGTTPPVREPDTPLEILARLRRDLAGGSRDQFPPTTEVRGTNRFFLVPTPMTWQQAGNFATDHGGHLAVCKNTAEQNWLSSKIPADTTVWIGGGAIGKSAWGWVDGTEWQVRSPSTSTGNAASLSDLGSIRSKPAGEQFPFFIQWDINAENAGTLEAQFERMKATLSSPNPVYPPGSLAYGSRHYLVIEREISWDEAAGIARSAGGHLAVPSEPTENEFLRQALTESLPAGTAAWIGGQHNGRAWAWSTAEPWSFAAWKEGSPDGDESEDTAVRFVAGPGGGWDDANPTDPQGAGAFLIEWSADRNTERTAATPAGEGDWAGLRQQAAKLVQEKQAAHTTALFENGKSLKWDLDFWFRGLRDNEKKAYGPVVEKVKALVEDDGRIAIPADVPVPLPPRGKRVVDGYQAKEKAIDASFLAELGNLRAIYVKKLDEKRAALSNSGLTSQTRAINNEIEACGSDGKAFLEHFGTGS